jgi:hypothetical protein
MPTPAFSDSGDDGDGVAAAESFLFEVVPRVQS